MSTSRTLRIPKVPKNPWRNLRWNPSRFGQTDLGRAVNWSTKLWWCSMIKGRQPLRSLVETRLTGLQIMLGHRFFCSSPKEPAEHLTSVSPSIAVASYALRQRSSVAVSCSALTFCQSLWRRLPYTLVLPRGPVPPLCMAPRCVCCSVWILCLISQRGEGGRAVGCIAKA